MREVLFRGKRADNGEWVYGYYVLTPANEHRIYWKPFMEATQNTYHKVLLETIGQFTGLIDRNGRGIFEGDIVKITGNNKPGTYIVIWDDYRVAWWGKNIKERNLEYDDDFFQLLGNCFQSDCREVIGNIYEK